MTSKWVFCAALLIYAGSSAMADVTVGEEPPDYVGKDGDGRKIQISEYRGKLVIVSFFASWCGPCRKELPMLATIQKKAGRDKVIVVGVDYKEDTTVVKKLRKAFEAYDVTITHDSSGSIGSKFGVKGIPRLVLVGKDGKVVAEHVGYGEESLPKLVEEINRFWSASSR